MNRVPSALIGRASTLILTVPLCPLIPKWWTEQLEGKGSRGWGGVHWGPTAVIHAGEDRIWTVERREGWERLRTHQDVASQVPRVKERQYP